MVLLNLYNSPLVQSRFFDDKYDNNQTNRVSYFALRHTERVGPKILYSGSDGQSISQGVVERHRGTAYVVGLKLLGTFQQINQYLKKEFCGWRGAGFIRTQILK